MVTTGARILVVLAVLALLGFPGGAETGRRGPPIEVAIEGRVGQTLVLDYDPATVTVWRDAARTDIAPLGASIAELGGQLRGDVDGDGELTLGDFLAVQSAFGAREGDDGYRAACDLDNDGRVDIADVQLLTQAMAAPVMLCKVYVDVRRRGIDPADAARLKPLDAAAVGADPGADFGPWPAVSIDPTSGRAGTAVTITMQTNPPSFQFDAQTTATYHCKFTPLVGPASQTFQVTWNAAQFREISQSQATIVVGDGSFIGAPDPETLEGPGTMSGTLTLHLSSGIDVSRSFSFGLETDAGTWEYVFYPTGVGGVDPPQIDGEASVLDNLPLSLLPAFLPTEDYLAGADGYQFAAVVRIDENPTTLASAPSTILVDLVSYSASGTELQRIDDVVLHRIDADGDPLNITYHNDLTKPIVFVDVLLNPASYSDVFVFYGVDGGSAAVVPAN